MSCRPAVRYHKQLHVPLQGDRIIENTPLAGKGRVRPAAFFLGLLLLHASTLMYEIALTRLLSVVSWYYLPFVSICLWTNPVGFRGR